ncbi:MAG: hypothetical protein RBU37_23195, partial [Myxococcota bacterium]|nr:hypothetical protein [Myxococcota bacterium]
AGAFEKEALAQALGIEKKGLAEAKAREAGAQAIEREALAKALGIEKHGLAEAVSVKEKLVAEAAGLAEKAAAMKALDGVGREHEEFRLRLDKDRAIELESIRIRKDIAQAQAQVLSQAFTNAKINIVGGDGAFFERFVKAVSLGQSVDAVVDHSSAVKTMFHDYLSGDSSLPADIKDVLSRPAVDAGDLQKLSLAALLTKLASGSEGDAKSKLRDLLKKAKDLGIDDLPTT